jgi:hypothetical protein
MALHHLGMLKKLDHLQRVRVKRSHYYIHFGKLKEFQSVCRRFGGKQRMRLTEQLLQLGQSFVLVSHQQQCFHTPLLPVPPEV